MKKYNKPALNIEKIELNDVILASGDNTGVDETFDPTNGNIDGTIVIPL